MRISVETILLYSYVSIRCITDDQQMCISVETILLYSFVTNRYETVFKWCPKLIMHALKI